MTFGEWVSETRDRIRTDGIAGVGESFYELELGACRRFTRLYNYGTPIWARDWDVLLILDACRYDLMEEVAPEFSFVQGLEATYSLGSSSQEWLENNFPDERADEMEDLVMVSANPFTTKVFYDYTCPECGEGVEFNTDTCTDCGDSISPDRSPTHRFRNLVEVWESDWNDEYNTVLAEAVTDRAIEQHLANPNSRTIVHYMQPHLPFVPDPLCNGMAGKTEGQYDVWDMLRDGAVTRQRVWEAYRENLRYVLGSVQKLLRCISADTVAVTADHGNLLGEWGIYGHPAEVPHPNLKRVPWFETQAHRTSEYVPTRRSSSSETDVVSRLRDLGYHQ